MFHSRKRTTNINVDERDIVQGSQGQKIGDGRIFANDGDVNVVDNSDKLLLKIAELNAGINRDNLSAIEKAFIRSSGLAKTALQENTSLSRNVINFSDAQTNRNARLTEHMTGQYSSFAREMVRRGQFASDKVLDSVDRINSRIMAHSQQSVSAVQRAFESANTSSSDTLSQYAVFGAIGLAMFTLYKQR